MGRERERRVGEQDLIGDPAGHVIELFIAQDIGHPERRLPVLSGSEQVAHPSQAQVGAGDLEPVFRGAEQRQPFCRLGADVAQQDAIRLLGPAPDALFQPLQRAGIAEADGFSLNVSNFQTTAVSTEFGKKLSEKIGNKPFVIDTSRNGNGSNGQWCNPSGRRIGTPTQKGGGAEMLLWIKTPGESDGNCGVGTGSTAGQFLPEVAYKMIYGY